MNRDNFPAGLVVPNSNAAPRSTTAVGLSMRPTQLLIFGDPKAGTPLMNEYPSLAIDLPLKAVAWESREGKAFLSFNSAEYLAERHHLAGEPFKAIESLLARAAD